MKFRKIDFLFALAFLAFAGMAAYSPSIPMETIAVESETGNGLSYEYAPVTGVIAKPYTKDTITNAANDTLSLNYILASPYQYSYQIRLTNISGTRSIKFYLEQISATGSTRWMKVDSAITSGSTINDYLMKGANTWGNKHRIIVDGAGTQSTAYQVDAWLKKSN